MSTIRLDVVCIGAATLDAIVTVRHPLPRDGRVLTRAGVVSGGGPAATAAVALVRQGLRVAFVGQVGTDATGRVVIDGLAAEGVDVSQFTSVDAVATGFSSILVDERDGSRLIVTRLPELRLPVTEEVLGMCREARWIHTDQTGWPLVAQLRAQGVATPVSLDGGNPIPGLKLRDVTLYAPTEPTLLSEAGTSELDEALEWALDAGARLVVVTRGASGSVAAARFDLTADGAAWKDRDIAHRPVEIISELAFSAPIVSTLGAGDVFHGALLAALCSGSSVQTALRKANQIAAQSCAALDGRSAIPRAGDPRVDNGNRVPG